MSKTSIPRKRKCLLQRHVMKKYEIATSRKGIANTCAKFYGNLYAKKGTRRMSVVLSCLVLSCLVLSCLVLSCLVLSGVDSVLQIKCCHFPRPRVEGTQKQLNSIRLTGGDTDLRKQLTTSHSPSVSIRSSSPHLSSRSRSILVRVSLEARATDSFRMHIWSAASFNASSACSDAPQNSTTPC